MALLHTHTSNRFRWALWQVSETLDELLSQLPDRALFEPTLDAYPAPRRKLERTAVHHLLWQMLQEPFTVGYRSDGKPLLLSHPHTDISISHTDGYVAVILGTPGVVVGIDVERYSPRILSLQSRIVHPISEKVYPYQGDPTWSILLHWSAKEVLFKCMGQQGVDFLEHLHIHPFQPQAGGTFQAHETRTPQQQSFEIGYRILPHCVLTWSVY